METNTDIFKQIPIKELFESTTNPRKHYDENAMKDLTESVKTKGILVPLLVRPVNNHFEIIAGSRRFKAAQLAGITDIPAIIKDLSDEDTLEAQVIENLQREDVHPLDEAEGYQALLNQGKYDVNAIAAKVGKSNVYIYQRLQLLKLNTKWQDHFNKDVLTLAHALLLARLTEHDQEKALNDDQVLRKHWKSGKMGICNMLELRQWIEDNCYKKLSNAAWDLNDEELIKEAGSCVNCPKRTGFNKGLFNDIKGDDICTDGKCFKKKQTRFFYTNLKTLETTGQKFVKVTLDDWGRTNTAGKKDYKVAKANAKNAVNAIVSEGRKKGKIFSVIVADKFINQQKKSKGGKSDNNNYEEQRKREEAANKLREIEVQRICNIRGEVFVEIAKKQKDFTVQDYHLIIDLITSQVGNNDGILSLAGIQNLVGPEKKVITWLKGLSVKEIQKYLILLLIADEVQINSYHLKNYKDKDDILYKKAKEFKIDTSTIEKKYEVKPEKVEKPKTKSTKKSKSVKSKK